MKIITSLGDESTRKQIEKLARHKKWPIEIGSPSDRNRKTLLNDVDLGIALIDRFSGGEDLSLITEIRQINPSACVILVVDKWDIEQARLALNNGAYDIILSPVDSLSLSSTLERALENVKAKRAARKTKTRLQLYQRELDIAAQIQKYILPSDKNMIENFDISASMIPAKEIGGDFYDFFMIDRNRLGFVIGDVSGKGVPAALFMAVCRSLTKATALQGWAPCECLSHINKVLSEDNPSAMFVTLFYGILNVQDKRLDYCIGGHDSPLLVGKGGEVKGLERTANMALGFDGEISYQSKTIYLGEGDALFLYTDGITEAESPANKLYGRDRLIESLQTLKGKSADEMIKGTLKNIKSFTLGTKQSDDITAMAFRLKIK